VKVSHFASLVLVLAVVAACPAVAATIHVPDEQPTIQAGIDAASAGDTVLVACGTYYEHDIEMKSGVWLSSETGLADCVTVDAQQLGRGMYCGDVDETATIGGITFVNGRAANAGGGLYLLRSTLAFVNCSFHSNDVYGAPDALGGAVYCSESSPAMTGCTFSANHAWRGGGMFCSDSSPVLVDCRFDANTAGEGAEGGGILCAGSSSPTLTNCTLLENRAWGGGGMYCGSSSSPTLIGCMFLDNTTFAYGTGGGAICYSASAVFTDCTFLGNHSTDDGGGMFVVGSCQVVGCVFSSNTSSGSGGGMTIHGSSTLADCVFFGNSASERGGGVYDCGLSTTFSACTFSGNDSGDEGGGLACESYTGAALTGCTFESNIAQSAGGALACGPYSTVTLTECTFADNTAGYDGGAIYSLNASTLLMNCTLTENCAGSSGGGMHCSGSSSTLTNCIISFSTCGEALSGSALFTCCDLYGNEGGDWVGSIEFWYGVNGNFSEDPLLCLQDNPEEPLALHEGSPCLPENSPCGQLVGALGLGCGPASAVEAVSWGSIKATFR
jgi:predicted outer membrane repeat protein/parallel beta-helix repeat protein